MPSTEFIITSLIVVLIPGTGVIYTISTGLFSGWKAAIAASIGCTLGIIPHLLASILGLAAILHMSALAFNTVKFIGVAYLFYLAWTMWRQTGTLKLEDRKSSSGLRDIALKAVLINILNPKLSLFFLAFLPQFVPAQTKAPLPEMLLLSVIFMLMTLLVFIVYGLFANGVRAHVANSPKIVARAQRSFAVIFAMLGAKLAMAER